MPLIGKNLHTQTKSSPGLKSSVLLGWTLSKLRALLSPKNKAVLPENEYE